MSVFLPKALYTSPRSPFFKCIFWLPVGYYTGHHGFLPGVTDNPKILLSVSVVSLSILSKGFSPWLFCNGLFLDLNEAVPETERLDSKALKTRAQLSVKNRRQRPSRTRLYDSVSSTDGEDSLERKVSALDRFLITVLGSILIPTVYWFFCNQILWPHLK